MNMISKFVLGGAGAALLGLGTLGATATPALAAAKAAPAAQAQKPDRDARRAVARAVFEAEADALGMKPEELREALKNGKTVSQIAAAKGLTKDQVADRMAASLKPALDKLVDAHKISRAEADRVLDRIAKGHIPFWNGRHHKKAGGNL